MELNLSKFRSWNYISSTEKTLFATLNGRDLSDTSHKRVILTNDIFIERLLNKELTNAVSSNGVGFINLEYNSSREGTNLASLSSGFWD